jgi:integrase
VRAIRLRAEHIDQFAERRRKGEGSKRGRKVGDVLIRRELEVLRTAYKYAVERGVLTYAPHIPLPSVGDNVRDVEIPLSGFPAILAAIENRDVRDFVEWLVLTAMRPKGVRGFLWSWFDGKTWTLKVPSEKGGNAREFSIEGSLRTVIERRIARRRLGCDLIFHRDGKPMRPKATRMAFYKALEACELPTGRAGYTLYDAKKTAVGLLLDAGLSDAEAMDFSGHKTPSMLNRYRAKTAKRHGASVRKRDEYLARVLADNPGTFADNLAGFRGDLVGMPGFEPGFDHTSASAFTAKHLNSQHGPRFRVWRFPAIYDPRTSPRTSPRLRNSGGGEHPASLRRYPVENRGGWLVKYGANLGGYSGSSGATSSGAGPSRARFQSASRGRVTYTLQWSRLLKVNGG